MIYKNKWEHLKDLAHQQQMYKKYCHFMKIGKISPPIKHLCGHNNMTHVMLKIVGLSVVCNKKIKNNVWNKRKHT